MNLSRLLVSLLVAEGAAIGGSGPTEMNSGGCNGDETSGVCMAQQAANGSAYCLQGDECQKCRSYQLDSCPGDLQSDSEFVNPPLPASFFAKVNTAAQNRLRRRRMEGKNVNILFIGPNTFQDEPKFFKDILGDLSQGVKLMLAEPNMRLHTAIKSNAASGGFHDVTVTHAAITDDEKLDLSFWWYEQSCADRVTSVLNEDDKRKVMYMLSAWSTFSRDRLEGLLDWEHWQYLPLVKRHGMDKALKSECIVSMEVPIISPKSWLNGLGVTPTEVDLFFVDAEGFDVQIMNSFLQLEGFKPEVVQFEWTGKQEPAPLLRQFAGMGYDVYQDHQDMVMIKQP